MPVQNERLKIARKQRGWSQAYLAEQIGVPDYYISRWERGEYWPSAHYQRQLCELFGKTAEELGLFSLTSEQNEKHTPLNQSGDTESRPYIPVLPPALRLPVFSTARRNTLASERVQATGRPQLPRTGMLLALLLVVLVLLSGAGLTTFLLLARANATAARLPVGYLRFESSGQTSETSNQGIADIVQFDLRPFHPPPAGQSDYAWLLPDANQPENPVVLLGKIGSDGILTYYDPRHANLLDTTSGFLVTEQDAAITPLAPSPDHSTWRYRGQIPQTVPPREQFSYLDHLRHLLTYDPTLHANQLAGGLVVWFSRTMAAIQRWTLAAAGDWQAHTPPDPGLVRQDTVRILVYLDGTSFVARDLPEGVTAPALVDERVGRIGVLESVPQQEPPGYVAHIILHLNGLLASPGADPALTGQVARIITAMNTVNGWLEHLRQDAKQLLALTDQQLRNLALTVLNDMTLTADRALNGWRDQQTGATQEGAAWIAQAIQGLAIISILPYTG